MKNLLNCHCIGLHSFPLELSANGLYKRIFHADTNHVLWRPIEVAIHPHHVDITITVLDGFLTNPIYEIAETGESFNKFIWNSHILNGNGGFVYSGKETLRLVSAITYGTGDIITMSASELHTVQIEQGKTCTWLIEEHKPTSEYTPINYSKQDLTQWKPDGLYIECGDDIKEKYIGKHLNKTLICQS